MSLRKQTLPDAAVAQQLSSDWAQHGYRSQDDAQQVASLVEDLIVHRKHVALSCSDADMLDHYSRLLVRDLRQRDGVKVVPYFPSSTEMLLARLNEMLARITIEQAMRRDAEQGQDIHVFVLHDTPSLANAELTLLVRLINDLPGTNLRLLLVLDSEDQQHARLPLLGKRSRHWDVPAPVAADAVWLQELAPLDKPIPVLKETVNDKTQQSQSEPKLSWWSRLTRKSAHKASAVASVALIAMCVWLIGVPVQESASQRVAMGTARAWQGTPVDVLPATTPAACIGGVQPPGAMCALSPEPS